MDDNRVEMLIEDIKEMIQSGKRADFCFNKLRKEYGGNYGEDDFVRQTINELTPFLEEKRKTAEPRRFGTTTLDSEMLYCVANDLKEHPKCVVCGSESVDFKNMKQGYRPVCSMKCNQYNEDVRNKIKNTCLERYGTECSLASEKTKEKIRNTCLEKYGTTSVFASEQVKDKIKKTNLERYGVENPFAAEEIKKRIRKTHLEKYGVEFPNQSKVVQEKRKQTTLNKYGVDHISKLPDYFQLWVTQTKPYTFPSGEIFEVQGYEPYALDDLLKEGINEQDIYVTPSLIEDQIGEIYYEFDGSHKYYPDIYVKSLNKIIEVKSTYTLAKDYGKNYAKKRRCLELDFCHEIWLYDFDQNKSLIRTIF